MLEQELPADNIDRPSTARSENVFITAIGERFDRITRIACQAFDVPIALISLLDSDRLCCKSCQGITLSEMPCSIFFCAQAMLSKETLVVPDTLRDPRFADAPSVIGEPFIRFYAGQPLSDRQGHILGTFCIIDKRPRQLSERELTILGDIAALATSELLAAQLGQHEQLLRDASECKRIDEVERMKAEFISIVNHELRTPLTSIRGSLGLLVGGVAGELPQKASAMLDIAYKNSERLVRLINDILDIENIESGRKPFVFKPLDLTALVQRALVDNQAYAEQQGVRFVMSQPLPDVQVLADADWLMQVLSNLLSNAARFSPLGGIVTVSIRREQRSVRVAISDQGMGISKEFRCRVFQKFVRTTLSDTHCRGGTGLGLSIAKAIIEKLGGTIGFESQTDVGTTFYFDLPEWHETMLPLTGEGETSPRSRILVCEDDPVVAELLQIILADHGFASDIAYDAFEAKRLLASNHYDGMTLDLKLPRQDGIALIRELRAQEATQDLPIVVVSARAAQGYAELAGDASAIVDWLDKPIDQDRLIAALRRTGQEPPGNRPRILYIEDDSDLLTIMSIVLQDVAVVTCARNLSEARDALQREAFDLVLLDLFLPDGSGMELLPCLNSQTGLPIPVVVFSGQEVDTISPTHRVQAALVKSRTSNQQLLDTVISLLGRKDSTGIPGSSTMKTTQSGASA